MLTLLWLILILGLLIFIHELGHFLMAKKFGVHIYEFALGMGPKIISKKGKDGILYSWRLFPIGGYVQMAGEVYEDDKKIKKEKFMCNKPWYQRLIVIIAGVTMNFILAWFLLLVSSLIWGHSSLEPVVGTLPEGYPAQKAGIEIGDRIISINDHRVNNWDKAIIEFNLKDDDGIYEIKVEKKNGSEEIYDVTPKLEKKDGNTSYVFGIGTDKTIHKGFLTSIEYSFVKFGTIIQQMSIVIVNLFTGNLSLNSLAGPVGMYSIVGDSVSYGAASVIYLIALLSINLGFINILPFPAFDGGRVLFMIIEKIKGSPVDSKIENTCHMIGFILLMILMVLITYNDILRLFK